MPVSSTTEKTTTAPAQKSNDFIIDTLNDDDNDILVPYSNRFHLSAAKDDATSFVKGESASYYLEQILQQQQNNKKPASKKIKFKGTPTNASSNKNDGGTFGGQSKLLYLDDDDLLAQFKSNPGGKRKIIISEPTYDQATLWRIHDIYRTDGAVSRNIETLVEFIVGRKRSSVTLDTNDYFDSDEDENITLKQIQSNDLYRKYVRGISKINKNLEMNEFEKMILTSGLVYGKAALLIEYDDDPILNESAMPIALKPLSSLRIGRVFYYEDTWQLAGIEYLDFQDVIVEPHRLIYFVNRDYHISPRTLWHGYSALETVIDIAETNILNNQTNIKEINRRLWADFLILKYMGKKKSDITKFKEKWKPGMPIISNRDFEAQVIQIKSALNDLIDQQNNADKKIARNLNVPQLLAGFDDTQSAASTGGTLNAWTSSVVETRRTQLRNIFEAQWINPLLKRLIILNGDSMQTLKDALKATKPEEVMPQTPPQLPGQINTGAVVNPQSISVLPRADKLPIRGLVHPPAGSEPPSTPATQDNNTNKTEIEDIIISNIELDPSTIIVTDLPFKVKMQFASFAVSTMVDLASVVIGLKNSGIIDWKLALEELDRKEYIPRMEIIQTQNQIMQQQQQQMMMAQQQDPNNPNATPPGQPPTNNNTQNNGPRGPDASKMGNAKTNLTNRTSKGSTVGKNPSSSF